MHNAKVGNEGVIHMLPKEGAGVEGVEGDSIGSAMNTVVSAVATRRYDLLNGAGVIYSFNRSSCDFLGIISSI